VDGWENRWFPSDAVKEAPESETNIDLYKYVGQWSVEEPKVNPALLGDTGLVVKTAAAHHAISAPFSQVLNPKGKDLVIQ
jgi:calnexin